MATIELKDERLRVAVERAKGMIEQRLQKLDRGSHQIKELERYLEVSGVRERVAFELSGGRTTLLDEDYGEASEDFEYVVWEPMGEKDRCRLTYLRTHRDGFFNIDDRDFGDGSGGGDGFCFPDGPEVLDHRPLIETPVEVRMRAVEALPDLLRMIASNIKVTRLA